MEQQTKSTNYLGFTLIIVFVLLVGALLAYLYLNPQKTTTIDSSAKKTNSQTLSTASVSVTKSGFVPASLTVTQGTQVTWTNADTAVHQVASDPYPLDDTLPNLKSDPLAKGDSFSFTFEKKGTFTYHDEKNPLSIKGTIIVN